MSEVAQRIQQHVTPAAPEGPPTVERLLEVQAPEIGRALAGGSMTADRFARVVLTEVKRTPRLRQCTAASLLGAVMLSAQLGLEPGPMQLSYLVPRRNRGTWEVQFQIGYRGMIDLAMRSGLVREVASHVVYANDEFEFDHGTEPYLRHRPSLTGERGEIVCAYAVARLTSGGAPFEVLRVDEIEARRARGAAGDTGPWLTDWAAMARKTAVRALEPYLPRSAELSTALRADGAVVTDYTHENLAESDVLDVDEVDEIDGPEESGGSPPPAQGEPVPAAVAHVPPGPESAQAPSDAHLSSEPVDAGGTPLDAADVIRLGKIGGALLAVEAYRATRKAGAAAARNALDEFLVTELGLPTDLEGALDTAEQADVIVEWLDRHPIGGDR